MTSELLIYAVHRGQDFSMRFVSLMLAILMAAMLACTMTSGDAARTQVAPANSAAPIITISQPLQRAVFEVGSTITVQAQASDPGGTGVTRVELRVNNVIVDSQTSQSPSGERTLSVLLDYIAAVPNPNLTLAVRAYRGVTASQDAIVTVIVNPKSSTAATPTLSSGTTGGTTGGGAIAPTINPIC